MWRDMGIDVVSGTCAGVAQVAFGHPLDTLKVRVQSAGQVVRGSIGSDGGTAAGPGDGLATPTQALRTTLRREGVRGLYKGAASPLCGAMLQNAAAFLFWGVSKKAVARACPADIVSAGGKDKDDNAAAGKLSVPGLVKAGLLVGCLCLLVENPVDLVKTQMQVQLGHGSEHQHRYRSVFHAGRVILRERGLPGLYQGMWANSLRFVPGRSVYLSSFEVTLRHLNSARSSSSSSTDKAAYYANCFLAGSFAGGAAWTSTYPFDVIRNIMMGDHIHPEQRRFRGVWHCGRTLVAEGGPGALWRGYLPCMLRGIPVNGCIFCAYTAIYEELSRRW